MRDHLADNLNRVQSEIAAACRRAGRLPSEVKLVAVTKYAELTEVRRLTELGVVDLGESRPQQLSERADQLSAGVQWHFIGHLQRNKVKPVLSHAVLIHSVDSLRLLERISAVAEEMSLRPRVLLEVNVSGETSKNGISNDELRSQWDVFQAVPNVEITGLMTMAPLVDDPETARPVFRQLRLLRDELTIRSLSHVKLTELSMGMSGDFAIAIEEGATLIRIGSRLFASP
ncbi:MAG: YggS family pyridoxal phosphate-dependent enzyme [Planctomycetia bacterium]|nr:YggS family pyridoxal phosphate-dependent enzyme [Planctomycetia bacterium]